MKYSALTILFLAISTSCHKSPAHMTCEDYDNTVLTVTIVKGKKNMAGSYSHAFGFDRVHKIDSLIFINHVGGDSGFSLPLSIHHDTSRFCLVKKDLSTDTICVSYNRTIAITKEYRVSGRCYLFKVNNLKIESLSDRFISDSIKIGKAPWGNYLTLEQK